MFPWQGTRISLLPQASNLCLGCSGVAPLFLAHSQEVKLASCFPRVGKVPLQSESLPSWLLTAMAFLQPFHLPSSLCTNSRLGEASLTLLSLFSKSSHSPFLTGNASFQPAPLRVRLTEQLGSGVRPACACWEDTVAEANRKCSWIKWEGPEFRLDALAEGWALC